MRGDKFAICFLDDGIFKLRVFTKEQRPQDVVESEDYNLNVMIGIDNETEPIEGFDDPFCTCCFVADDLIAVSLFHSPTRLHYHFIVDDENRRLFDGFQAFAIPDCSSRNFPYKSFFSSEDNEVYTLYRQA